MKWSARLLDLRARCIAAALLGVALALAPWLARAVRTLLVLAQLVGISAPAGLRGMVADVETQELTLALGDSPAMPVAALRYRPRGVARTPAVLLLHGVHPSGIHEPRLIGFARALASGGLDVLTPELPDLLAYRLDPRTVPQIQQLAAAHARTAQTRAVGVIGISFAGGLALMAAGAQPRSGPIAFVLAVGAHHDLSRLCRYYAGEAVRGPHGENVDVAPHPYGARVMLREHLERFFSADDLPIARLALDRYLQERYAEARDGAKQLSASGQKTMAVLLGPGRSPELAELLLREADASSPQLMAASPHGKLGGLAVPVLLLHGASDPIIPSIESRYLAREVPRPFLRSLLITPLLRHAELGNAASAEQIVQLLRLVMAVYAEAGSAQRAIAAPASAPRR